MYKLDTGESAFFERQLEAIKTQTYDVRFPALKARRYIPVDNSVNGGATSVTYRQFDKKGQAKIVANAARDVPRVDISGAEFNRPVREVAASYGWTFKEIKSAMMAGFDLNSRRALTVREAIERELDEIACFGAPVHGITSGFLNEPNISVTAAAGAWSALTPDQIIADVTNMWNRIVTNSLETEEPNTLLLPTAAWSQVSVRRVTDTGSTILKYLREAFPGMTFEPWYRLNTAGAGSVTRAVMYNRSPLMLTQDIPAEVEQLPVQEVGLELLVNMVASTAGTAVYYPKAADFIDGL